MEISFGLWSSVSWIALQSCKGSHRTAAYHPRTAHCVSKESIYNICFLISLTLLIAGGSSSLFFDVVWALGESFSLNVQQVLMGPVFKKKTWLIWANLSKAVLVEIWFERNQRTFHGKETHWPDRFEIASRNAAAWCTLHKDFEAFSIQDISLNWQDIISPNHWVPFFLFLKRRQNFFVISESSRA